MCIASLLIYYYLFPDGVTDRPNCHWGRQCRTQVHNPGHAKYEPHFSLLDT